jgi:hypothetical protein
MNILLKHLSIREGNSGLGKNLSIPKALFYNGPREDNISPFQSLEKTVHKFTCKNNEYCIDRGIYDKLVNNVMPFKSETVKREKNLTRGKSSKSSKSMRKSRKK